jgi:hypothetical protein
MWVRRSSAILGALSLTFTAGCADILGFQELTGEGGPPDASYVVEAGPDGPAEAAVDGTVDAPVDDDATVDCGPTNTTDNCGACGVSCDLTHAYGGTCDGTKCIYSCADGWADCGGDVHDSDGCETDTTTTANCGGCGQACDTQTSTKQTCDGVTCSYTCKPGYLDCNTAAPDTDGCEATVDGGNSCAVCGRAGCDTTHSGTFTCHTGTGAPFCTYNGCSAGFADCNTTPPDTHGCDMPTTTTANCGGCGNSCDTTRSDGTSCDTSTAPGKCAYTGCKAGWMDCNPSGFDTDGCETSSTSVVSCAGCTNSCDTMTGTPSCDGTTCAYKCKAGRADCNNLTPPDIDGCECPTPGCCATKCETTHSNGIGNLFYDCVNAGSHALLQAQAACAAAGAQGCNTSSKCCLLNLLGACVGNSAYSVCGTVNGQCYCWQYDHGAGDAPGTVQQVNPSACSAICSSSGNPTWN